MTNLSDGSPLDEAALEYWRDRIAVVAGACRIESQALTAGDPIHQSVVLDGGCADGLRQLGRGNATALFTLACGSLAAAMSYFLGRDAVVMTVPARTTASETAGPDVPLVIVTRGHADLRALLQHAKHVVTGAFTHSWGTAIAGGDVLYAASNIGLRMDGFSANFDPDTRPGCVFSFDGIDRLSLTAAGGSMTLDDARAALSMWAHCLQQYDRLDLPLTTETVFPAWLWREIEKTSYGESVRFDGAGLIDLVDASFAEHGDRIAVRDADGDLSYSELDRLSSALAAQLATSMGIGPGKRVGIMVPRSRRMVIALLAVIRSGAAFVPMSCGWSQSRCADIVRQTRMALVVIDSPMMMDVLEYGIPAYVLDVQLPALGDGTVPGVPRDPDSIAYIMFTSGSTGSPKGVEVRHRNIANTLAWRRSYYRLDSSHVSLQIPPFYFDSAIEDILSFVVAGSCLLLPDEDKRLQVEYLRGIVGRSRVTHVMLVPAIYQRLLATSPGLFEGFESITLAGEAVAESLVREHFRLHPRVRLFNEYGPTENAVCSTAAELIDTGRAPSIGCAIANTFVFVVDDDLRPVVPGCSGELLVGGAGVAKGYLDNATLTDERFVSLAWLHGERAYRTGDRGRYTEHGSLEYLGRVDDTMVKVNGVRIEPGEVESCMLGHAAVSAAVVGLDEAHKLLAVYTGPAREDELRPWLGRRLPSYMLPQHVVCLDDFPLLGNGKIDRARVLADGQRHVLAQARTGGAARTQTEAALVQMWREVLQDPDIGVTDNYFRCGGDSIRAIQITAAVARMFGVDVNMAELYSSPSVELLANIIDAKTASGTAGIAEKPVQWRLDDEEFAELQARSQKIFPVSDVSLGMLFHTMSDTDSAVYHDQTAFLVSGVDLEQSIVERVLGDMCAGHDVLRTTFHLEHTVPVQAVAHAVRPEIHWMDWQTLSRSEQDRLLQDHLRADRQKGFAVDQAPPWRMAVFDCGQRGFAVSMSLHHALMDGWSSALFWDEFFRRVNGSWQALAPCEASCRDLVVEQAGLAQDDEIRAFWAEELKDARPFELPTFTRRQPAAQEAAVWLDPEIALRLHALADTLGIAVRSCYVLGYLVALSRVSFDQDLVAGIVENVRPQKAGGDRVLGCFLNTVPLRFPIDFGVAAATLLRRLDAKVTVLKRFGRASLPSILQASGRERGSELFSSVFVYLNFHVLESTRDAIRVEDDVFGHDRANTALDLIVNESNGRTHIKLKYDEGRVSADLARGLVASFTTALDLLSREPEEPLSLNAIVGATRARLDGPSPPAYEHPITLIRSAAARHGTNEALVCEDGSVVSYVELLAWVDAIAAKLLQHVGTQDEQPRVALVFSRRDRHVVAMLASLTAGACFVPLEADISGARLDSLLEDARVDLILTDTQLQHELPILRWLELTATGVADAARPPRRLEDALAYILFTSGSSGRPKGVRIRLDGLSNLLQSTPDAFGIDSLSRCLQFSAVSFDASIHEMLIPLCRGATVCLVPDAARRDMTQLARYIDSERIDNVALTPSVATLLDWTSLSQVRTLITVGEAPLPADAEAWSGQRRYVNAYGPTEATVCTSVFVAGPDDDAATVPIGFPLAGVSVDVVDSRRQPMLLGSLGEIAISGRGVGQGYVGDPASTTAAFESPGAHYAGRTYYSGDLAYIDPRNGLHFAGRRDGQIKRNGVRIDRDGITAIALRLDAVHRAAALFDGQVLALFVVPHMAHPVVEPADLGERVADHLRQHLGARHSPDLIVVVGELPLLTSGKMDERRLWSQVRTREDTAICQLSQEFRAIVEQVLGHRRFSAGDGFFDAGGDSLKSIRLAAALHKAYPCAPTVAEITCAANLLELESIVKRGDDRPRPESSQDRMDGAVALTRAQQRLIALGQFEHGANTYNLPAAVEINGLLRIDVLMAALQTLVRTHRILFSRLDFAGDEPCLQLLDPGSFEPALDTGAGEDAETVVRALLGRPFDLMHDPLARFALVRSSGDRHILAVSLHHAIADGISIEILLEDLFEAYAALAGGSDVARAPVSAAPAVHSRREAEWLDGEQGRAAEAFWRDRISRLDRLPALPRSPGPCGESGAGHVRVELPSAVLADHQQQHPGDTEFDVFLAGFGAWLASATGEPRNSFVTTVSTRDLPGAQRAIGPFINTLLVESLPRGDASPREAFARARHEFGERSRHRSYPFDLVVAMLREKGLDARNACGFTWVGDLARSLPQVQGLCLAPLDVSFPVVKADLWVYVAKVEAGYRLTFEYDRQHFSRSQVEQWAEHYATIIRQLRHAGPDAPAVGKGIRQQGIARRSRGSAPVSPVIHSRLFDDGTAPLLVQPRLSGMRLDAWLEQNRATLRQWLDEHGAILLRGFEITDERALHGIVTAAGLSPLEYRYRSTPRRELEQRIYSSTEYPSAEKIPQHHENSYTTRYPALLWFACFDDRFTGGCTPLSDGSDVHARLDPVIRSELIERGLCYVRRYDNFVDLSWQETFQTTERGAVESACAERGIDWKWLDGGVLETRQSAQVHIVHPASGRLIWFNQAHLFFRAGQALDVVEGACSRHVMFADGSEIPSVYIDEIRRCYDACEQRFAWSRGDVLVLDNLRYAHGRDPFLGSRRIAVAMTDAPATAT